MALKNFVLDTNVLLHDPDCIFQFGDNTVVIPIVVIEEVDTFKKNPSELGRNARQVSRHIDALRSQGSLIEGVQLPDGSSGILKVVVCNTELPRGHAISHEADSVIMSTALQVKQESQGPTVLITMDTNLRIRANALGLDSVDYDTGDIAIDELYPGSTDVDVPQGSITELYDRRQLDASGLTDSPLLVNEYVMLREGARTALTRLNAHGQLEPIYPLKDSVWGIRPRNREQHYALDACLREDIKLVTLVGKAGTGKTLLALAAGLAKVTDEEIYQRLLCSRPVMPMGRDIGFLPGDIDDKLRPWMQPIHDNVELLLTLGSRREKARRGRGAAELIDMGLLEVEPLTYIRGRSLPNQYMVIDEAQNLTPHEVKTILTRAGEGTKVVLTGDPFQIDNPYVDSASNGLTYLVERFKGESIAATVTLSKGERSPLAEIASNRL
ncbi:MAG: PhoH family protein [Myxococcota bacterium]